MWTPNNSADAEHNKTLQTLCATSPGSSAVQSAPDCQNLSKTIQISQAPNPYSVETKYDIVRKIPVGDHLFALVDASDLPLLEGLKWAPLHVKHITYAQCTKAGVGLMHRLLMGLKKGDPRKVDHKDRNGLNNTRKNMRVGTQSQNRANSKKLKPAQSQYKGVVRRGEKWIAQICAGKQRYLGIFKNEEDAARAYDHAALGKFGEYARLNFPSPAPDRRAA